jgi:hypothetical protein
MAGAAEQQQKLANAQTSAGAADQQQFIPQGSMASATDLASGQQQLSARVQSTAGAICQQQFLQRGSPAGTAAVNWNPEALTTAAAGTISEMRQWAIDQELSMMDVSTV